MKKTLLILIVAFSTTLNASTKEESKMMDTIVEAFRSANSEEGTAKLKELNPTSYKAIADLIKRSVEQDGKVEQLERQVEDQKQFQKALNLRLSQEFEQIFKGNEANETYVFISASLSLDESWKAVLEVKQTTIDSSYWVIEKEIPLSPKEAIKKVLESDFFKENIKEPVTVTRCSLWASHLCERSSIYQPLSNTIPFHSLIANYTINVSAGNGSYPFMVLMDGTVISPRIEEK